MEQRRPRQSWDVSDQVSLDDLLEWCRDEHKVDRLIVATRIRDRKHGGGLMAPRVDEICAELFGRRLLQQSFVRGWPGTRLLDRLGKVYVVKFDDSLVDRMARVEREWTKWTQWHEPPLPEDICAYRYGDSQPTLVSVTHDQDAWIYHDGHVPASMARKSTVCVPAELIPGPPSFLLCDE